MHVKPEIEKIAEQLHEWYLDAICKLPTDVYNPKAKKPYNKLTSNQKEI